MVTKNSPLGIVSSAPSLFKASHPWGNPPLLLRINWAFGFYVACLTASVSACLYKLYQAYQLVHHTSFGLDDRFKLVKCQALFEEAQKKNFQSAQPLLRRCEDLLATIDTTSSYGKQSFLVQLAQYYAKDAPQRSYQMAQRLSSSYELFAVAQSIQKHHPSDVDKLNVLFSRAYEAKNQEDKRHPRLRILLTTCREIVEFAEIFHSLNNFKLANQCMTKALELANAETEALGQFRAFCQIAKCYRKMENPEQMKSSIELARALLTDKIVGVDVIGALLSLANTFFSTVQFRRMDQELQEVVLLIEKDDPLKTVKNLYPLAKLISEISKSEKAESTFKDFQVEDLIDKALTALKENKLSSLDRAEVYLGIASIYQEGLLNPSAKGKEVLNHAFQEIQNLPEDTDEAINSKIDLLLHLSYFYEKDVEMLHKIIQSLEGFFDHTPKLRLEKPGFGKQILELYNKTRLKTQSDVFFQKYLLDLQTRHKDKDIFNKINQLVTYADYYGDYDDNVKNQIRLQLEVAEALLPRITSSISYKHTLSRIMQGYLQIDRQKGLDLLEKYENQQARSCLITAIAIAAAVMGIARFYPEASPFLLLGASALHLSQGSF
jgi:hypothetical protein